MKFGYKKIQHIYKKQTLYIKRKEKNAKKNDDEK